MNSELKWTTEKPTKPGVYWAFNGNEVFPVDVSFGRGSCEIHGLGDYYSEMMIYGSDFFTHWMGPLQPPEPPKVSA